jgi:predicted nucleic acid-binding protein
MIAESFTVLLPTAADYSRARGNLENHITGLRAGDAMHLAIAKNHAAEALNSFDKTMLKAGSIIGVNVTSGIPMSR